MSEIKLVINDIDDCWGNFRPKPRFPEKQDVKSHVKELDQIRDALKEHSRSGVLHSVCTGRAFYSIEPLIRYVGVSAPSAFEHGTSVWDPRREAKGRLVDLNFPELVTPSDQLELFIRTFDHNSFVEGFRNGMSFLRENAHILTYEFTHLKSEQVYAELLRKMPGELKRCLERGDLKYICSGEAVDVIPRVNKGDGVRYIIKSLGLRKDQVLGIEDSYHSGLPMLQEVGHVACPANAQPALMEYVKSRNGYVASKPLTQGWLEIIDHYLGSSKN